MHYIVFDLEWNIAGHANKVDPAVKAAIPFEIIEIGAVRLDEDFKPLNRFSVNVRPQLYPILSGYVAAVTRRMQQSMKFGLSFQDAARSFRDFCGDDFVFCTWSDSDIATLKMNLDFFGLASLMPARSLDVQYLFDALIERSGMQRSIEYAIDFLRIPKNQPFHQAVTDAHYTGRILSEIVATIRRETGTEDVISPFLVDPSLTRSQTQYLPELVGLKETLPMLDANQALCPACGEPLCRELPWTLRRRSADALFICPQHGRVAGRLRIKPKPGNRFSGQLSFRLLRHLEELRSDEREGGANGDNVANGEQMVNGSLEPDALAVKDLVESQMDSALEDLPKHEKK